MKEANENVKCEKRKRRRKGIYESNVYNFFIIFWGDDTQIGLRGIYLTV